MKIPQPKYEFGQILLIQAEHNQDVYEDCLDCFQGSLKVIGAVGKVTKVTCPTCKGSGHSYKVKHRAKVTTIDGMLQITRVQIEVSQEPREDGWSRDGVRYQGKVVWRSDIPDSQKSWNVFSEHLLIPID